MKLTKQEREDFRTEQKALKSGLKTAKKQLSKAKKVIRKESKRVAKTELLIGKHYYRDHIRQEIRYPEKYTRWCTAIKAAKDEIEIRTQEQQTAKQRVESLKLELKLNKLAQKKGVIPAIILE